ncbi:MAG TPA: hypothetical protein PLC52_05380 [Anaerolineales bacterium]|nr:hypothetical protein [Anaerolineales bacterium]HRQ92280.1 hypothetical protein [Anaerolineales bacterium]
MPTFLVQHSVWTLAVFYLQLSSFEPYDFTLGDKVGGDKHNFVSSTLVDIGVNLVIGAAVAVVAALLVSVSLLTAAAGTAVLIGSIFVGIGVSIFYPDQIQEMKDALSERSRDLEASRQLDEDSE